MQEPQVQSLGQKDPLEERTVIHSSILAGKSHGQRSLVAYIPWGVKASGMTERLNNDVFSVEALRSIHFITVDH